MLWICLLVLGVAALCYMATPLLAHGAGERPASHPMTVRLETLQNQRAELDLDHSTGKVSGDEYSRLCAELDAETAVARQRAQRAGVVFAAPVSSASSTERQHDAAIEAEILIARARLRNRSVAAV